MRSKGTAAALESRRRLAVRRIADGWTQREVADFLGVHPITVAKWVARHRADPRDGLKAQPTPGRPPFLTADQERAVLHWIRESPTDHGFDTELWTARRLAEVIAREFGIRFHPHYLCDWLAKRNFTPQKPTRRVRQRDEDAIRRWVARTWPQIQKSAR
jgi:transposase